LSGAPKLLRTRKIINKKTRVSLPSPNNLEFNIPLIIIFFLLLLSLSLFCSTIHIFQFYPIFCHIHFNIDKYKYSLLFFSSNKRGNIKPSTRWLPFFDNSAIKHCPSHERLGKSFSYPRIGALGLLLEVVVVLLLGVATLMV